MKNTIRLVLIHFYQIEGSFDNTELMVQQIPYRLVFYKNVEPFYLN